MKTTKISTYSDLLAALSQLSPEQLSQKIISTAKSDEWIHSDVTEIEVQEYDFYKQKNEEDGDFGTLEELKEIHGDTFDIENYEIAIPKGTIILN